jgi:transcription antitermination factor NusG
VTQFPPSVDEWFAVRVWTGREQMAARHLRLRGYDVFLPCYWERRMWSDRTKKVDRALFAGYVFCQMQAAVVAHIVGTPCVIHIVGDGSRPIPVPVEEIDSIRRIVGASPQAEPWPFVQGEMVRIDAGPLAGAHGVVVKVNQRQRLVVSIRLLQRSVAVELDPACARVPHRAYVGVALHLG